jgi:sec-independent protein translocase protein TatA
MGKVAGVMSATLRVKTLPVVDELSEGDRPMGSMSIMHWMIVIAVVVLLFGRGKISGLMADVADGIKSFKKGMREDDPGSNTVASPEPHIEPTALLPKPAVEKTHEHV